MCAGPDEHASRSPSSRILIVSGDPKARADWRSLLEGQDCVLSEAENGEEAVHAIKAGSVDLIISALKMMKIDGLELLRVARELPASPPIIVIAHGQSEMNQIYLRSAHVLGAAGAYMEPLDARDVKARIKALLGLKPK